MDVPARITLVTLGVTDVAASTAFYTALGWQLSAASVPGDVSFVKTAGVTLALWGRTDLAADSGVEPGTPGGVTLAVNLEGRTEVDAAVGAWVSAGGRLVRAAGETEWGGYTAYVADPDGHLWEIAHNPFWPLDERGLPVLP
jgi:catechol 2,3-dioxygenase-like lactoylglutathione lyase family enzyme